MNRHSRKCHLVAPFLLAGVGACSSAPELNDLTCTPDTAAHTQETIYRPAITGPCPTFEDGSVSCSVSSATIDATAPLVVTKCSVESID